MVTKFKNEKVLQPWCQELDCDTVCPIDIKSHSRCKNKMIFYFNNDINWGQINQLYNLDWLNSFP